MLNLLLFTLLSVSTDTLPPDGPYLTYQGDVLVARWADTDARTAGELEFREENYDLLPHFTAFRPKLVDADRSFEPREHEVYENVDRVVALSDVHGQFETGARLLQANAVIDEELNWQFGDGHLVIVGDIFDRGDQVTELLWLIHNLEGQAEAAGGRVHFLLGNHETMILHGDDRYLNARYRTTSSLLQTFYKDLYGPDTYLGRWLRSLPLAVKVNDNVYVHGGFSREMVRAEEDIDRINELYREKLLDAGTELREVRSSSRRLNTMYGADGPLWYRGYFSREAFSEKDLEYVLRKIGAKRIIVGHTSFTAVQTFFEGRIIAVDSSIKFGGVGELLYIKDSEYFRGTIDGTLIPLEDTTK